MDAPVGIGAIVLQNLLSPPVLFFFLGILARVLGSDLEVPAPLPKFLSMYLLMAIGFKGGVELGAVGLERRAVLTLAAAVAMATAVPLYTYAILRRWLRLDVPNAAAVAAAFGSISAVTFITAESFLGVVGEPFDGYMVAALALMESPAIVVGLLLVKAYGDPRDTGKAHKARTGSDAAEAQAMLAKRWYENKDGGATQDARNHAGGALPAPTPPPPATTSAILREACCNGSVFLLVGSLAIGVLGQRFSPAGVARMAPFVGGVFYGLLALFLLDMGVVAAGRLRDLRAAGPALVAFSVCTPLANAAVSIFIAAALGLSRGNALLLTVLGASASYIAVPAALRVAVPAASPTLYLTTALGITFPFNVVVGIPLYMAVINAVIARGGGGDAVAGSAAEAGGLAEAVSPDRVMGRAFVGQG